MYIFSYSFLWRVGYYSLIFPWRLPTLFQCCGNTHDVMTCRLNNCHWRGCRCNTKLELTPVSPSKQWSWMITLLYNYGGVIKYQLLVSKIHVSHVAKFMTSKSVITCNRHFWSNVKFIPYMKMWANKTYI